jgi:putative membrane protein
MKAKGQIRSCTEPISPSTELSLNRTFMAYERTLMAWIRTSTSLISFGFSIYKFFQYLVESGRALRPDRLFGAREFAISMISIGIIALGIAVVEHRHDWKILEETYGRKHRSLANKLALIIFVVGLFALLLALLHK